MAAQREQPVCQIQLFALSPRKLREAQLMLRELDVQSRRQRSCAQLGDGGVMAGEITGKKRNARPERIATGGEDGTVRFWDRRSGRHLATLHPVDRGFLWRSDDRGLRSRGRFAAAH